MREFRREATAMIKRAVWGRMWNSMPRSAAQFSRRLRCRALEDRTAPATFAVLNDADAGSDSLRQALLDANASPGPDSITFDTTYFATARTIKLTTAQLAITDAVTIIGPGANLVRVSGNNMFRVPFIDAPGSGSAV